MQAIEIRPYDLPDSELINDTADCRVLVWRPDRIMLVIGASNKPEISLNTDAVLKDNVEVYKRHSGGEAVVLTPHTLVVSAVFQARDFPSPKIFFKKITESIITALARLKVNGLIHKGISDIAAGEKKILGSAIYRSRDKLLFHAVLNLAEPVSTIDKYLAHPSREPDYRRGRPHSDFVTSLSELGHPADFTKLKESIETEIVKLKFNG